MAELVSSEQSLDQGVSHADLGGGVQTATALDIRPESRDRDLSRTGSSPADGAFEDVTDDEILAELSQLRRAMETRPTIDQACGVLMATFGLSPDAAWRALVTTSQNTNTKLHRVAGELVGTAQGSPLRDPLRKQLAAAVKKSAATTPAPLPTP